MKRWQRFAALLAALCVAGPAFGAEAADGPQVIRLTVRPRAVEKPALRNRLLPTPAEQTEGNAAQLYVIAILQCSQHRPDELKPAEVEGRGLPAPATTERLEYFLKEVPTELLARPDVARDAETTLRPFTDAFVSMDAAARRDYCRWELPLREQGFRLLLPHLQGVRQLTRARVLQARLLVARGDFEGAVAALRATFRMSRDVAADGFLIQQLVGAGVAAEALAGVRELIQRPDGPNLYWPLAALPRPMADLRLAMAWERAGMLATFPQLRKVETGDFNADDWRAFTAALQSWQDTVASWESATQPKPHAPLWAESLAGVLMYPRAKQFLIDRGATPAEVEAMPVPRVLGTYVYREYEEWADESAKWFALPYWQARDGLSRAEAQFAQARRGASPNPLLTFMPAISRAYFAGARLDRDIAAVQTVEALRAYAAAHDGRLPRTLEEITDTPAPLDPTTGAAFVYRVEGDRATLESPAPPGHLPRDGLRVELTLSRDEKLQENP